MKLPFKCAVCGIELGIYEGKLFYVIPALESTRVVCVKCEKEGIYQAIWLKDAETKRNQTIRAISERIKRG